MYALMETIVFLNSDMEVCCVYRSNMVSLFDIGTLIRDTGNHLHLPSPSIVDIDVHFDAKIEELSWKLETFREGGCRVAGSAYIYRMTGLLIDDDTTLVSWRRFFKTPPTRHELLLGTLILKYELAGLDLHQISGQSKVTVDHKNSDING